MNKLNIALVICFMMTLFFACESYGLVTGPARFEVSLPPGEIAEGDYYVQNDTEQSAHIIVEPENWFKDAYDYGKLEIKDWIEFDTYEFDLKPKEIKKLRLKIKVPKDVKGELVAQIFFTSDVLKEDGKPSGGIKARLGSILYVAIKGTEKIDAEIGNIVISKMSDGSKEKLKVEATVRNKGNVHLRPAGKATIQDNTGKKLVELDLAFGKTTLPGQENGYDALWDNPELKVGTYKISVTVNYGKELGMEKTISTDKIFEVSDDGKVMVK